MNSLRAMTKKIDAILLMIIALLTLTLVLSWNYYQSRKMTRVEKEVLAAEMLAYDLPVQAVKVLENVIARRPLSDKSMRLRKVLADIYINEFRDYESALAELIFIKTFKPEKAEALEEDIRLCMNRLGRVYDVERRIMLDDGISPLEADVTDETVVQIGNKSLITANDVKSRVKQMGIDYKTLTADSIEAIVQSMAHEKLLLRAAKREPISQQPEFIDRLRIMENNLLVTTYLEQHVFDGLELDETTLNNFIVQNRSLYSEPDHVVYSCYAFNSANDAENYILKRKTQGDFESEDIDKRVVTMELRQRTDELPVEIRSINFSLPDAQGFFGPVKINNEYLLYEIIRFERGKTVCEKEIKELSKSQLLEEKQRDLLLKKINRLVKAEEMKISKNAIESNFFKDSTKNAD